MEYKLDFRDMVNEQTYPHSVESQDPVVRSDRLDCTIMMVAAKADCSECCRGVTVGAAAASAAEAEQPATELAAKADYSCTREVTAEAAAATAVTAEAAAATAEAAVAAARSP